MDEEREREREIERGGRMTNSFHHHHPGGKRRLHAYIRIHTQNKAHICISAHAHTNLVFVFLHADQ